MLVDDAHLNLLNGCKEHPEGFGFLVAQPWNKGYRLPKNVVRRPITELPATAKELFKLT
jgi:hypothetical protein